MVLYRIGINTKFLNFFPGFLVVGSGRGIGKEEFSFAGWSISLDRHDDGRTDENTILALLSYNNSPFLNSET